MEGRREVQVPHRARPGVHKLLAHNIVVTQLSMLTDQPFFSPLEHLLCWVEGGPS